MALSDWKAYGMDTTGGLFGDISRRLGLRERGISEALGGNKTSLYVEPEYYSPLTYQTYTPTLDYQGGAAGTEGLSDPTAPTDTGGSAATGGGGGTGTIQEEQEKAEDVGEGEKSAEEESYKKQIEELNKAKDEAIAHLDNVIKQGENMQEGVREDVLSGALERIRVLDDQKAEAEAQYKLQLDSAQRRRELAEGDTRRAREDALTEATRTYNELFQGGHQRFGGASSAGEAFRALTGQQLQRNQQRYQDTYQNNMAKITSQFEDFSQQVDQAKQNLQSQYSTAVQNLESEKQRQLNKVKSDFQNRIMQIESQKADIKGDASQYKLSALQEMRNAVFSINADVESYRRALEAEAREEARALDTSLAQRASALNQAIAGVGTGTNPMPGERNILGGTAAAAQPVGPSGEYTGIRTRDDEEYSLAGGGGGGGSW